MSGEHGNRPGWTFDTAIIAGCVALSGVIVWVRTARAGDSKAVDVALVSTKSALSDTSDSTKGQFEAIRGENRAEFDGIRSEIKVLAKAVAEGLSGLNTALKLIAGLGTIGAIGALIFYQ
jgi:hypothetical protein